MTPAALADLHARAFTVPRPWTAAEIADLLAGRMSVLIAHRAGRGS
jgi:[ribosomal protein S18]-alanine N-acetyltransferase